MTLTEKQLKRTINKAIRDVIVNDVIIPSQQISLNGAKLYLSTFFNKDKK